MQIKIVAKLDTSTNDKVLEKEKKDLIKVARDLRYPVEVVESIKNAQTPLELDRIMKSARSKARG